MIKKQNFILAVFFFSLVCFFPVFASEPPTIYIDNEKTDFPVSPVIQNDRILVPMRTIFESLGYSVIWEPKEKTITGIKGSTNIQMQIDQKTAQKNGKPISLETPPILIQSTTMVPIRFVAESVQAEVDWNTDSHIVHITSAESKNQTPSLEDSVVLIQTDKLQGSGVILSKNGLIATNFHVLEGATSVRITFQNNRTYTGNLVIAGYNAEKDLAVIKIDAVHLHPVKLSESSSPAPGQPVIAIGSPLGTKNLITTGTILDMKNGLIRISAPLDHGSSGGGLFNDTQELIGITTSYHNNKKNHYFAVPIEDIKKLGTKSTFLLSSLPELNTFPSPVKNIKVQYEKENAYLSWDYQYNADYYYIYKQNPATKEYEKEKNPNTQLFAWYWGYPYSFGLDTKTFSTASYKVAAVKNGHISPLSNAVTINGVS